MLEITEPVAICDQFTTASHYILLRRIGQIAGCKEPCLSLLVKLQAKMFIIQVNTHTIRYRTFFLQPHTIRIVTNSASTKAFLLKYEAFVEVTTILFVARAKVKVAHMRE